MPVPLRAMNPFLRSVISFRSLTLAATALAAGALFATTLSSRGVAETSVSAANERKPVPDFVMKTLDGKDWRLSDHKGRVVLINLFATWCPPCRAEMPMLVESAKAFAPKGVDFVGVSLDQGGAKVLQPFISKYKIDFPVVLPGEGPSIADGVSSIPVTVLVDRSGRLAQAYAGMVSESELKRDLDLLVAEGR
jgi:thiol-disulfide isomerase/thioredoxin